MSSKQGFEFFAVSLSSYVRPKIEENKSRDWVLNGKQNSFYQYIIDRNNGSPTNSAVNKSYADLIFGRGLSSKNTNSQMEGWLFLKSVLKDSELKKIITDFQIFGEASIQVIKTKGNKKKIAEIAHIPKNLVVPSLENEDGEIENYWYCKDWRQISKYPPVKYPAFGTSNEAIEIYVIKPYSPSKNYFADPDYLAGLPYAEMEEEIANNNINSIRQGLSAGYIINVPEGHSWSDEQKEEFKRQIKAKLTGSNNASQFVVSFNGTEVQITITPFPINENIHKQWEFLTEEAKQQILTSHRATSPSLVGIISSSGFSNTADEMDTAEEQLVKRVIRPKQEFILSAIDDIISTQGIFLDLFFLPLTEAQQQSVNMSSQDTYKGVNFNEIATKLIELGEEIDENEWEVLEDEPCEAITLSESQLNNIIRLAQSPKTTDKNSAQDTSLFKIRYKYAGNPLPQREFCRKVINANKVYRAEDLDDNYNYNEEFAPSGRSSYNIFLFKGGVNCKHFWQRVIYLKKGNEQISVNDARKMILELDPKDRKEARWKENDSRVAKIAEEENNYWSLQPNYRR